MPRCKITNWTTIRKMCRQRFAVHTADEVEVRAMTLAWQRAEEEVAAFEHEDELFEEAMEEAAKEAAKVTVGKMHTFTARKAVETVAKVAAMVALREILHEAAMALLEAVAKEAAKVAMRKLRQGVVARDAEAQMYMDDAAAEEDRVADAAEVTTTWELIDGDETKVEDVTRRRRSTTPSSVLWRRPSARQRLTPLGRPGRIDPIASPRWGRKRRAYPIELVRTHADQMRQSTRDSCPNC
jgi:hypothetical protein